MEEMTAKFNDVTERDMDLLFLEEIVSSQEFANIFLSRIGLANTGVIEIEHSKTVVEFGESDMTVLVSIGDKKHALLIEDKVDAIAMPQQCERYFKRGELGVKNGEYDDFDIFIVAPQKYLSQNTEAGKYPNKITYEECAEYFKTQKDIRSSFKLQQISQAIDKQKHGYQVIENKSVTEFWDKYIDYQEQNYNGLWLLSKRGAKGFNARWPQYGTVIKNVYIYHKSEFGFVDMTLPGCAEKLVLLEREFGNNTWDSFEDGMTFEKTGKAASIRIRVEALDFAKPFENYNIEIPRCFEAVAKLTALAKEMSLHENIIKIING